MGPHQEKGEKQFI